MSAPAFGTSGTQFSNTSSGPAFAVPASVASGDIIVIPMFLDSTATITAMASGFAHAEGSPVSITGAGAHSLCVVWKRATGSDTGTYTFTLSASVYVEGQALRYTGAVGSGTPFDSPTGTNSDNTNGTVSPAVSVTTAGDDRMLVFAATNWSGGSWTPPTSFTERQDGNAGIVTADDLVQASQGGSGTVQATCTGNDKRTAWLGALIGTTASGGSVPWAPPRPPQFRDPGETWWIQRDRRDANTVATAANPLVAPLDSAWQASAAYWHAYNDSATRSRRLVPQQRPYVSDPLLLTTAELEGALLGGADDLVRHRHAGVYTDRRLVPQQRAYISEPGMLATAELENELLGGADGRQRRYNAPAELVDRRMVPQQRAYVSAPGLLDAAELENELLGGASTAMRANTPVTNAPRWWMPQQPQRETFYFDAGPDVPPLTLSWGAGGRYWALYSQAGWQPDRREMPQQRAYISDPSFYPTVPPTDPLTLAWGAGGTYWLLYNTAALQVDRREVPQQRRYLSDPGLLSTALLEDVLLGGADDRQRHAAWFTDRRETVPQRLPVDPGLLAGTDPLTLAAGVGGDLWRRTNAPAYWDRREVPQQPLRQTLYFDAGPDVPPLTVAWGAGGALWHLYQWRRPPRSWWPPRPLFAPLGDPCTILRPSTGTTTRPGSGTTARPFSGTTSDPC